MQTQKTGSGPPARWRETRNNAANHACCHLNNTGNQRAFTLPLTPQLLPLAHTLLRVKCRYMSLVCTNVTNKSLCRVFPFQTFLQPGGKPVQRRGRKPSACITCPATEGSVAIYETPSRQMSNNSVVQHAQMTAPFTKLARRSVRHNIQSMFVYE